MQIPREDALAFFPSSVTVGNITLKPLTLAVAVRLGEIGVDLGRRVPRELLFKAAWLLDGHSCPFDQFCRAVDVGLHELSIAVEKVLNDAYATYVKPAKEKSEVISLSPHGLGWPLEYAEFICGEYGWSWETAINLPVATVFALVAANRQRNGGKHGGFDYLEREYAQSLKD